MMTEHRAGTYVYNDVMRSPPARATWDDCAMQIRLTVVSRSDAGPRHTRRRLEGAHLATSIS